MEKIVRQGILYDFYGALLSDHQRKIYEELVYNDMSLTEISKEEGISRQAVSDLIRRTTAQLEEYDRKLALIERFQKIRAVCADMKQSESISEQSHAEEILRVL